MATFNQYNINNTNGRLFFSIVENPVVEPLDGPLFVEHLMVRFPEETYSKSRDSHLFRFLTALVGDSGAGVLKKQSLFARLQFESIALGFKGLDKLYSPLIKFDRLQDEKYSIDPKKSALTSEEWDAIKAADNSYRNRAFNYLQAARQGGTLGGITAAGTAAIGKPVQVVENYKYLFDQMSDKPVGYEKIGLTRSINEFIIRPTVNRSEISTDVYATLSFTSGVTGTFRFVYNGEYSSYVSTENISSDILLYTLIGFSFLETGDAAVTQRTSTAFEIRFSPVDIRKLSIESDDLTVGVDVALKQSSDNDLFYSSSFGDPNQEYFDAFVEGSDLTGLEPRERATDYLDPAVQKNLDKLVSQIKPVTSVFSVSPSENKYSTIKVNSVHSSSSRFSVNRFVSASNSINYPAKNLLKGFFLEVDKENEERNYAFTSTDLPVVFITIDNVIAYTNAATADPTYSTSAFYTGNDPKYKQYESVHVGSYVRDEALIYPAIASVQVDTPLYASNLLPANDTNAVARGAITT